MKAVKNYLKNITTSFSYSVADVAKNEFAPNVGEFASINKDAIKQTYAIFKSPKLLVANTINTVKDSKIYKAVDYGAKNAFEDLRSGQFYNKEREDRDILKFSGMNVDDWNDLSDFDIDDDWENNTSKDNGVSAGDLKISESVERSNAAVANTTAAALTAVADAGMKNSRMNTGIIFSQNERLFSAIRGDMSTLNSNLSSLLQLSTTVFKNIDNNMADYFSKQINIDTERNAMLKEILEMQRNTYKSAVEREKAENKRSDKKRWSDISSNGMPDLGEYYNVLKGNMNNIIQSNFGMMGGFGEDSNMLATMMSSPLKAITNTLVSGIIPATVKLAAKELDKSLSGVFGTFMGKISNMANGDNPLLSKVASLFGIRTSVSRAIDSTKYYKEAIPFDGITRKAIIDVIPTYLRRIEATLRGKQEVIFDYNSGKWTTGKNLNDEFKAINKSSVNRATSDIRQEMGDGIKSVTPTNLNDQLDFNKALEEFWSYLYNNNGIFNPKASFDKNKIPNTNTALKKYYKVITTIYENSTKYSTRLNTSKNVLSAKDSEEKQYRGIEDSVGNAMSQLFTSLKIDDHGKYVGEGNNKFEAKNDRLITVRDSLHNNIFDYLQKTVSELEWQRTVGYQNVETLLSSGTISGGGKLIKNSKELIDASSVKVDDMKWQNSAYVSSQNQSKIDHEKSLAITKKAIKAISQGKAIALDDFEDDEAKEQLIKLANAVQSNYKDGYYKELNGLVESNAVSSFFNKNIYSNNLKSVKDLEDKKKNNNETSELTDDTERDEKEKDTTLDRLKRAFKKTTGSISKIASAPAEIFTDLLSSADRAIYNMFYKTKIEKDENDTEGKTYNGFMDFLTSKVSNSFESLSKKIQDKIIDPLKEKLGIGDDFKDRTKDSIKKIGTNMFGKFIKANKEVYTENPAVEHLKEKYGIAEKIKTQTKDNRSNNRGSSLSDMRYIETVDNIADTKLSSILSKMGKKSTDFKSVEEAKKFAQDKLRESIYNNSKGLSEIKEGSELDSASEYILSQDNASEIILNIAKKNGYSISGSNAKELMKDLKSKIVKANKHKDLTDKLLNKYGTDKLSKFAEEGKFSGSIEDKKSKLRKMGVTEYKLSKANTEDELNLLFNLAQKGHHAFGAMSKPFTGRTMLSKGELLINDSGVSMVNGTDAYDINKPTHIMSSYDSYPILKNLGINNGPRKTPYEDLKDENKIKSKISNNAKGTGVNINSLSTGDIAESLKQYAPEGVAGGVVGAVISTLLGVVGGPLLGAAVGAGTSIISSSDKLKEKLFGPLDDEGNRAGGIIKSNVIKAVDKYAPDMGKYGMAGIIPGMLTPLGPLGGILIGSTVGFLKNNETFSNKYFGENGKLTLDDKTKGVIQKTFPNMAIGAGAGALVSFVFGGPFGLLGNAALGSAMGLVSSTDEFKDGILGRKINGTRQGGLAGEIRKAFRPLTNIGKEIKDGLVSVIDNKIVDPLQRFITPFIHSLPHAGGKVANVINAILGKIFSPVGSKIAEWGSKLLDTKAGKFMKKYTTKLVKGTGKLATNIVTSPFWALGKVGDHLKKGQINRGEANYMTAEKRNKWRIDKKMSVDKFDTMLEGIGKKNGMSVDDANALRNNMNSITDTARDIGFDTSKQKSIMIKRIKAYATSDGGSFKKGTRADLIRAVEAEDMDSFDRIIRSSLLTNNRTMTDKEREDFMNGKDEDGNSFSSVSKHYIDLKNRKKKIGNMDGKAKSKAFKNIQSTLESQFGIKVNNYRDLSKYSKLIETELVDRGANGTGNEDGNSAVLDETLSETTKQTDAIYDLTDVMRETRDVIYAIANGATTGDIRDKVDSDLNRATSSANREYSDRKNELKDLIGKGEYDNLSDEQKDMYTSSDNIKWGVKNNSALDALKKGTVKPNQAGANPTGNHIGLIAKLRQGGYEFEYSAIKEFSSMSNVNASKLSKVLTNQELQVLIGDRKLNSEDIRTLVSLNNNEVTALINRCEQFVELNRTYKDFGSIKDILNVPSSTLSGWKLAYDTGMEGTSNDDEISNNSFGTIAKTAFNFAKGKVGSLFSKNKDKEKDDDSTEPNKQLTSLGSLMGMVETSNSTQPQASSGSYDEIDDPGDKRDLQFIPEINRYAKVKKDTDGSISFDTSDAMTKTTMSLLSAKDKTKEKLLQLQEKAMGTMHNAFNVSDRKESKKGKLSWWELLLGAIIAAPVLKKVFNSVIKPLWDDAIKPFVTKAWDSTIEPFLTKKLPSLIGTVVTKGVGILVKSLPSLLKSAVSETSKVIDGLTKTKTEKEQDKVTVNTSDLSDGNESGMYTLDEKGNKVKVSGADVKSGNYSGELYNQNGDVGTVNGDGTITFDNKDEKSSTGGKIINGIFRAGVSGKARFATFANKGFKKLAKHGGFLGKTVGGVGQAITSPIIGASKIKDAYKGFKDSKSTSKLGKIKDGLKSAANAAKAPKRGVKAVVKDKIESTTSLINKLLETIKKLINKIFNTSFVKGKMKDVAEEMGKSPDDATKALKAATTETLTKSVKEGGEEIAKKAGKESIKQVAGKLIAIVPVIADLTYGYDNAEGLLGVNETTFVENIICSIVNAVVNFIPFLSIVLTPAKACQIIITIIKGESFKKRQEESTEEYNNYVNETGFTGAQEDYNNRNNFTYKVKKKAGDAWGWVKNKASYVGKKVSNSWIGKKAIGAAKWVGSTVSKGFNSVKNFFTGKGKYGMGTAKQIDPSISNIRFNVPGDSQYQTIGDSGCGPAAAINAIHSMYGTGNSGEVLDAAKYAISNGYKEKDGGTKPEFFTNYFAKHGLDSDYTSNKNALVNNIANGKPTVLMGQDNNGVSSSNPFGRNPHYVTATNMVDNNKVVVQDPESKYDSQVYDINDLISKTTLGVSAYGKYKNNMSKYGRSKYGRAASVRGGTVNEQMFNYFIDHGFTPEAAAGIMGNMVQESGTDGNGQILLHTTESTGEGIGITQWSGGRKKKFINYCSSEGEPWPNCSLATQLAYIIKELSGGEEWLWSGYSGNKAYDSKYNISYDKFKTCNDIDLATGAFCAKYERCYFYNAHLSDVRIPSATKFYNQFSGNTPIPVADSGSTNGGDNTDQQSSSNNGGILSKISGIFTDAIVNSDAGKAVKAMSGLSSPLYDKIFGSDKASNTDANSNSGSSGSSSVSGDTPADGASVDANGARSTVVNLMKYLDKNKVKYSQSQRNPEKGSADCSSTVQYAYLKTLGIDPGSWTGAQIDKGTKADGAGTPTEGNLKPGDLTFYHSGNPSSSSHVEMYIGDGKLLGHGGGSNGTVPGPNVHDLMKYRTNQYMGARRYINDGEQYTFTNKSSLPWLSAKGGNDNKPVAKYGRFTPSSNVKIDYKDVNNKTQRGYTNPPTGYGTNKIVNSQQKDYTALIKVLIETLINICDNTDKLNLIAKILQDKLNINISSSDVSNNTNMASIKSRLKNVLLNDSSPLIEQYSKDDASISSIISAMNAIASE